MLSLFFSFAYSHLNYCISTWCTTNFCLLDSLQRCCNIILRIRFFRGSRSNRDDIYKKFEILKILDIHKLKVGFYTFFHNMFPQCFSESFKLNFAVHHRQTKKDNDIHVPFTINVICPQLILFNGAKIWSDIPVDIRYPHNLTIFRNN